MKRFFYFLPAIVWAGFIFYMSTRQGVSLPPFPFADKVAHIGAYTIFGFFIALGLGTKSGMDRVQLAVITMLIAGLYGLSDEIHQTYVPTRSAEALDLLSDFVGGLLGATIYGYRTFYSQKS